MTIIWMFENLFNNKIIWKRNHGIFEIENATNY